MNWFTRFLLPGGGAALSAATAGVPSLPQALSPFAGDSTAHALVYSDLYPGAADAVDRNAAMTVAPVKRGRAIIVGSVADLPLASGAFDGDTWTPAGRQPVWLNSTRTVQTTWHRMALTLDDLIFHGWSLWALQRTEAGTITDAVRIAPNRWTFDSHSPTGIAIDAQPVTDPTKVCLFAGPDEGVLVTGRDVIRGARAIERAWVGRVRNPIPLTVLHEVEQNGIQQAEAQQHVAAYAEARRSPDGAVAFLPATLNLETYGDVNADLFIEGRNAVRLDVANLLNLPASLLDGSTASASLTYVTQEGQRTSLIDWLEYWLAPIEARLSQEDITPRGQLVRFDRSNLIAVPNDTHGPEQDETPEAVAPAPEQPAVEAAA